MLYLQIASPKSSVLNFLDSNSFEVIISIFQRTEKVPDMERLLFLCYFFYNIYYRTCICIYKYLHFTSNLLSSAVINWCSYFYKIS